MEGINTRVLFKEPRGFIRILQILLSILAWSTTARFSTTTTLHLDCPDPNVTVDYKIKYPFDLTETEISSPLSCKDYINEVTDSFPIDFSATSMLYVLVCALSLFYAIGSIIYYCLYTAKYETDPLCPMVDLGATLSLTIYWVVITCTWALNVSDLKHYTHPRYYSEHLTICRDPEANCQPSDIGKWSSLTISIVCGFVCIILWLLSTWFIFKETTLHKKQTYQSSDSPQATQQYLSNQQQTGI